VKERLAEGLTAHYGWQPDEAYARGERMLRDLERRLASIRLVADAIDARMAGFNRLSQQRYNYQTELRGRRPEIVKAYCDAINEAHAGTKLSGFKDTVPDFTPLVPEMKCFYGVESLARTRRVRAAADLTFDVDGNPRDDEDDTLAALKERQRLALTPQRAARLVARLLDEVAASIGTQTIQSASIDDVLDLLATAAYDHATMADGRVLRWSADGPRRVDGLAPDGVPMDEQADWTIERFTLTRQA